MRNTDETEYIVLNRTEDAEESETGKKDTENQQKLSQYRYFDCEAVQKSMNLTVAEL